MPSSLFVSPDPPRHRQIRRAPVLTGVSVPPQKGNHPMLARRVGTGTGVPHEEEAQPPMRSRPFRSIAFRMGLVLLGVSLLVTGCRAAATPSSPPGATTLASRTTALGAVLTDAEGRTLYLFEKDEKKESYCHRACAAIWPPLSPRGQPRVTGNADATLMGTITRDDGTKQVTYGGHPLYYYVADNSRPGSLDGEDVKQFGASWYVVSPKGEKLEKGGS